MEKMSKKPEEIKKGLECCRPIWKRDHFKTCDSACPYVNEGHFCRTMLYSDALAMIRQHEAEKAKLKRERDAAVADMRNANICICLVCANFNGRNPAARKNLCKEFGELSDEGIRNILSCGGFKWRGPCKENTENP